MSSLSLRPFLKNCHVMLKSAAQNFRNIPQNARKLGQLRSFPIEDQVLFWTGFTYVPSAILTPVMSNWQLRRSDIPAYERNLLVKTEVARQLIGALSHFAGFFGGLFLYGLGKSPTGKSKTFHKLAVSIVGATISYAFLRPWLTNLYTARWVKKNRPQSALPPVFLVNTHPPLPMDTPRTTLRVVNSPVLRPLLFQANRPNPFAKG